MTKSKFAVGPVFVIAIVLALSSFALAAGQGGPIEEPPVQGAAAMARAQECGMFGTVNAVGNDYSGAYVSFEMSNGVIENYTVGEPETLLLERFEVSGFGYTSVQTGGALVTVSGAMGDIYVHNNRPSILHFTKASQAATIVTIVMAPGMTAVKAAGSNNFDISGSVEALAMVGNGTTQINGSVVTVSYASASGSFTMRVDQQSGDGLRAQVQRMTLDGGLAGEMDIVAAQGGSAQDGLCYNATTRMTAEAAGNGTLSLRVQAEYSHGMAFRIGTDYDTIGAKNADAVRAKLDGEKMKRVSAGELVQYQAENRAEAAYCVESSGLGCDVLVYVPHFSEHVVTIESAEASSIPALPAVATVVAIVVAAFAVAFRAKRSR